jgi:LysR family transcriptional regulator for bpeEF and oprC
MTKTGHDKLDTIAIFVRVAQSESFTHAARQLGLSASGVSRAITRLESRLSTRLVDRTTRRLALTVEGSAYFERCRKILSELEDAEALIAQTVAVPRGPLHLQVPHGFGRTVIAPALSGFLALYPEVSVDVTAQDGAIDPSEDGVDASFVLGEPAARGFVARRLTTIGYAICAAPNYLKQHGTPETLADLTEHRCLNYRRQRSGRAREWALSVDNASVMLEVDAVLTANDIQVVHQAALSGIGLAYLMDFLIADDVKAGRLLIIMKKHILRGVPVHVCYPKNQHQSPRLTAFLEYLGTAFGAEPSWSINRLVPD